ncbi:MAG: dienelactone hydrolase family protein [Nocardioidaceae bacterium]
MTQPTSSVAHIDTDDGPMPGHLWLPPLGTGPGLLLLHEIFGVSDYIKRRGADLAALGYVVLAPEIFWRLDDSEIDESAPDFLEQAMAVVGRLDWPTAVEDSRAALAHLRRLDQVSGGVGVIGFCFGGGLAFNLAAVDSPDVLVSYYGSALPNLLDLAPKVTAPSLHHFGLADAYLDPDTVMRIRAAVTAQSNTRFETYGGAGHAFDNPRPEFHDATASAQAWRTTTAFLADKLPPR